VSDCVCVWLEVTDIVSEGLCVCVWDADTVNEELWDCDRDCVDEGVIVALELWVTLAVTV
jgi:hypothetical protein